MPKVTEVDKLIPKIYRRKYSDLGLFFYVKAQKGIMPAITTTKAIENYHRFVGEDDYDIQYCLCVITRMEHEFYENLKDENAKKNI